MQLGDAPLPPMSVRDSALRPSNRAAPHLPLLMTAKPRSTRTACASFVSLRGGGGWHSDRQAYDAPSSRKQYDAKRRGRVVGMKARWSVPPRGLHGSRARNPPQCSIWELILVLSRHAALPRRGLVGYEAYITIFLRNPSLLPIRSSIFYWPPPSRS